MSIRERSAWIELIALTAVWGFYFVSLVGAASSGAIQTEGFARVMGVPFAVCAVLSILVGAASGILQEIGSRRSNAPARDEREAWAGLRATRVAHGALIVLLLALTVIALLFGAFAGQTIAGQATGWLGGLMVGMDHKESLGLGAVLNGRGVMELVVAGIAYQNGFIGPTMFSTLVLMGIVTTFLTPIFFKQVYRGNKLEEYRQESRK